MASLYKRNGWYYLQFYSKDRQPRMKQVALQVQHKRDAQRLKLKLEDRFEQADFDPWSDSIYEERPDLKQLGAAVDAFLKSRANLRHHTLRRYRSVLGLLESFLGADVAVTGIKSDCLMEFLETTDTNAVTKHSYTRAMKTFFNWLINQAVLSDNPAAKLRLERAPQKHPRYLSPEDVDAVCRAISNQPNKSHVVSDTCTWLIPIVKANVFLGLRAGELVNLKWEDVDLERGILKVVNTETFTTKSGSERTLPLCDQVIAILRKLERRCEYVFPNYGGTQLHRAYLSRRFKHFARIADVPEYINFHTTRHTAASWLAQQGCGVEAIRLYMGHSSISVTQKYMHLSPQAFSDQINRAFGGV